MAGPLLGYIAAHRYIGMLPSSSKEQERDPPLGPIVLLRDVVVVVVEEKNFLVFFYSFFFGRPTGVARVCPSRLLFSSSSTRRRPWKCVCVRAARPSGAAQHQKTFDNKTHAEKKKKKKKIGCCAVVYNPG